MFPAKTSSAHMRLAVRGKQISGPGGLAASTLPTRIPRNWFFKVRRVISSGAEDVRRAALVVVRGSTQKQQVQPLWRSQATIHYGDPKPRSVSATMAGLGDTDIALFCEASAEQPERPHASVRASGKHIASFEQEHAFLTRPKKTKHAFLSIHTSCRSRNVISPARLCTVLPFQRRPHLPLDPGHRPRAPVDHARVDHSNARARVQDPQRLLAVLDTTRGKEDLLRGALAAPLAAGRARLQRVSVQEFAVPPNQVQRAVEHGRPGEAARLGQRGLVAPVEPHALGHDARPPLGGVADDDAVDAARVDGLHDALHLRGLVLVRRHLHHDAGLGPAAGPAGLVDHRGQDPPQGLGGLQVAQAGGVGRADVDDEDVGVGREPVHAVDVVAGHGVDVALVRLLLLRDLHAQQAAGEQAARGHVAVAVQHVALREADRLGEAAHAVPQPRGHGVRAAAVQPVPVDHALDGGDAEAAGLGVAILRARGTAADLDNARAQGEEGVRNVGVLIKPRGDADGVCHLVVEDGGGEVGGLGEDAGGARWALAGVQTQFVQDFKGDCADVVGVFCVGEQRANQWRDEPLVDGGARVGCVEVREVEGRGQGSGESNCAEAN